MGQRTQAAMKMTVRKRVTSPAMMRTMMKMRKRRKKTSLCL